MSLVQGSLLAGRFRVTGAPLGRGESGVVWPARDEIGHRDVAVKLLHAHLADDTSSLDVLRAEAAAAGRLKHENIVEVFGLWSESGQSFLVSDHFEGVALSGVSSPMAPEAVIALGYELAGALSAAHRSGLVHGDVRPGNVLIGADGARLFDFGIATWLCRVGRHDLVALRPGVTAPEIQMGGRAGIPADLYGLGVVMYRALHGKLPWDGPTEWAVMGAQAQTRPSMAPGPAGLVTLIGALLEPDPTHRPCDADVVMGTLAKLRRDPNRLVRPQTRWIAPIRPTRAWIIHGVDPGTGGPAVVRSGLSRRAASALQERLEAEGWAVSVSKEALDGVDLGWALVLGVAFGIAVPVVGFVFGFGLGLRWRSAGVRAEIREALPRLSVQLPARRVPGGTEYAVSAGLLMLVTGVLLWWWPVLALVPSALLGVVVWMSFTHPAPDLGRRAEHGRVATVFAEIASAIEGRQHDLDDALLLQGELVELERQWHSHRMGREEVLIRARLLQERASAGDRVEDVNLTETLDRLRRL